MSSSTPSPTPTPTPSTRHRYGYIRTLSLLTLGFAFAPVISPLPTSASIPSSSSSTTTENLKRRWSDSDLMPHFVFKEVEEEEEKLKQFVPQFIKATTAATDSNPQFVEFDLDPKAPSVVVVNDPKAPVVVMVEDSVSSSSSQSRTSPSSSSQSSLPIVFVSSDQSDTSSSSSQQQNSDQNNSPPPPPPPPPAAPQENRITDRLSNCQYRLLLKMTSVIETSNPELGFSACSTTNDGQGISAGFIQFTTCGGAARKVYSRYCEITNWGSSFCQANFMNALDNAYHASYCSNTWGQYTPAGLENFCNHWQSAANNDEAFRRAQMEIQKADYFDVILPAADKYRIKRALTFGKLMDISIQLGPHNFDDVVSKTASQIGGAVGDRGYDGSEITETAWLSALLDQHYNKVMAIGGAYAGTTYRIDAYRRLLNEGNMDFSNGALSFLGHHLSC